MSKIKEYNDKEWLTPIGISSTPSVVSFCGLTLYRKDEDLYKEYLIEISSCHDKVRLHKTGNQTVKDWVAQTELLYNHIGRYLEFLNDNIDELEENE